MSDQIQLEIHRPDEPPVVQSMGLGIYTVGSEDENSIVLPGDEVSERHGVLGITEDDCWIEDLASDNGIFLDGARVENRQTVKIGQRMRICHYELVLSAPSVTAPVPEHHEVEIHAEAAPAPTPADEIPELVPRKKSRKVSKAAERKLAIKKQIHEELVNRLNLKRLTAARIGEDDLRDRARELIRTIIAEVGTKLPKDIKPDVLAKELYDEAIGLGPIEDLLEDPEVTEIMVNGFDRIYVERNGKLTLTDFVFLDNASVHAIIERIVSPLGRRIDESQPYVDARLKDGSRVNAIIHPLSLIGPCLTIRKFSKTPLTDRDLVRFNTMTDMMAKLSRACVMARKNIVISGGTGSGKTTVLNVFGAFIPDTDRIVTIEDAAELRLEQDHVVSLEARPPNIEGRGAITIRDLVRNALRMRPDRVIVGECRGGEALDMLQAMNTGHDGSLTTVHANSPRDVISRLETMVLMSGMDLPVRAIREQIAAAIDVIVHTARMSDGTRKIVSISEVVGLEGERITMQEIFSFSQEGIGQDGTVEGSFVPTGSVPTFIDEFQRRGITLLPEMFNPNQAKGCP